MIVIIISCIGPNMIIVITSRFMPGSGFRIWGSGVSLTGLEGPVRLQPASPGVQGLGRRYIPHKDEGLWGL